MFYGLSGQQDALLWARIICNTLGHGANHCAVQLLIETAQQETRLGEYKDPTPDGAGTGLCQIDEGTFKDIVQRTKSDDCKIIQECFGVRFHSVVKHGKSYPGVQYRELKFSPMLSFLFCRLKYKLISEEIPVSREGRARYWKKYYNTIRGKGTIEEYLWNAKQIRVKYW